MTSYTLGEQAYLQRLAKRLIQLRAFLTSTDFEKDLSITQRFEYLAEVKSIQGNINNDISFIACLIAKDYLSQRFNISKFDVSIKPQGAPGLDIDLMSSNGERIIGEIKTTVPYSGAKNDLGGESEKSLQ